MTRRGRAVEGRGVPSRKPAAPRRFVFSFVPRLPRRRGGRGRRSSPPSRRESDSNARGVSVTRVEGGGGVTVHNGCRDVAQPRIRSRCRTAMTTSHRSSDMPGNSKILGFLVIVINVCLNLPERQQRPSEMTNDFLRREVWNLGAGLGGCCFTRGGREGSPFARQTRARARVTRSRDAHARSRDDGRSSSIRGPGAQV